MPSAGRDGSGGAVMGSAVVDRGAAYCSKTSCMVREMSSKLTRYWYSENR